MKKTVLITGSSSGIGRATVIYFQQKGWNVAATMRSPEKEEELTKLENVICIKLDVTDTLSIKRAIKKCLETFGVVDVVVNNAGYGVVGPFEFASEDQIVKQFSTNVFGVMTVIRELLPYFRSKRKGVIVTVSSMGGRFGLPLYSLYHATKFALEGFTESLFYELRQFNIKLKLVEPGVIKTEFYSRSAELLLNPIKDYDSYLHRVLPSFLRSGSRGASPEVVAKVIFEAANDSSRRLRYSASTLGRLLIFLRRYLPDRIFMYAVERASVK